MKKIIKYLPLLALLFVGCQSNDEENFANKGFIDTKPMVSETIIKGTMTDFSKTLNISLARPAETEVKATFAADPSLVDTYNKAYYAHATALPTECYKLETSEVSVPVGSVKSTNATITFQQLNTLNRDLVYVLPVKVTSNNIDLLSSSKTYYYIFRAGSLINVVADMENSNYLTVKWATPDRVSNMTKVTFEALIKARDLSKLISTVMGIEGYFLLRIGDADRKGNQLQLATGSGGNFPAPDATKGLPINKWVHVAMTLDCETHKVIIYVDGKIQSEGNLNLRSVDIRGNGSDRDFMIGFSYSSGRELDGYISEVRVWDVVRTQEEIAKNIYSVDPKSEGLVGYWKLDDQSGTEVKDYTGNGNTATANAKLKWINVSLPEK